MSSFTYDDSGYQDTVGAATVTVSSTVMCWLCCWQLAVVPALLLVFQAPHHCKYFQPDN